MEAQPQPRFFKQNGESLQKKAEQVNQFFNKNAQMPSVRKSEKQ